MPFTKEQQEAITRRGSNIIVSAGAGSGKTAVLSERILSFCKEGNDIRRVLVLTFTEKAAQEMKERIRQVYKAQRIGMFDLIFKAKDGTVSSSAASFASFGTNSPVGR